MTEQELDSLGFRQDEDLNSKWNWGSYTIQNSDGTISYIPILSYSTRGNELWCNPFHFERVVDKFDTMHSIINSVSNLMAQHA
jgi:hypothetical protein